jgi:dsDNA-binding SOS-regulon protein
MDENETTVIDRFNEYRETVEKKKADYYDSLLETNKEFIDNLTDKPDYSMIMNYL